MKNVYLTFGRAVLLASSRFGQTALGPSRHRRICPDGFASNLVTVDLTLEDGTAYRACYQITVITCRKDLDIGRSDQRHLNRRGRDLGLDWP